MNGNFRWGTGAHRHGCEHLWSEWETVEGTPLAYLRFKPPAEIRWCLFCTTPEYR